MCLKRVSAVCSLFAGLLVFAGTATAHSEATTGDVPSFRALRVNAPLTLDGLLDEPFWKEADVATDFVSSRTHVSAEEQSEVRIAYTTAYVYVGVVCHDSKIEDLRATERREDRMFGGDDWVEIQFDPFHSHRIKYAFFTNPLGTRLDAKAGTGSRSFNIGWSAEWDVATTVQDDYWGFEMRIPLSVLNYSGSDGQTWGVNFARTLRRDDVTSFWSFSATDTYDPPYFGHMTGMELADSVFDRNWEISPYVSSQVGISGESDVDAEVGLDVGVRLTPSITSSWAINPDFGQVEADAETIELRDTERLLPERRAFFREGEELFSMHNRLYYSRRFSDINTAAKISGRVGRTDFITQNIQGDMTHDETRHGNSSIFRGIREVGEKSRFGYFVSGSELDDGHSRVAGVDGELYMTDDVAVRFQGATSDDLYEGAKDPENEKDGTDHLGYGVLKYEKYPWFIGLGYKAITEEFDPILAYIPRNDIFGPFFDAWFSIDADDRWYRELGSRFSVDLYEDEDGRTTVRDYEYEAEILLPSDIEIGVEHETSFHDPFDNRKSGMELGFFANDNWKTLSFGWLNGTFEETDFNEFELEKNIKLTERLPVRYTFTMRFEEDEDGDEETVWLNQIVFDYYFTDVMWLKTSLQHQDDSVHNISVIYGWELSEHIDWYLVYNNVQEEQDEDEIEVPEEESSIFSKVVYTF